MLLEENQLRHRQGVAPAPCVSHAGHRQTDMVGEKAELTQVQLRFGGAATIFRTCIKPSRGNALHGRGSEHVFPITLHVCGTAFVSVDYRYASSRF